MSGGFMWFIVIWMFVFAGLMAIGGFFMFRKFLKVLPKQDGKSDMDWEVHYVEQSLHLWGPKEKELLNELVSPVPELFRPVAKQKIAGRIGQIALEEGAKRIELDHIIRGYILATPKRDHKFLVKKLDSLGIGHAHYAQLFARAE